MRTSERVSNIAARARNIFSFGLAIILLLGSGLSAWGQGATASSSASGDWKQVEAAMGRPGQMQAGGVIRFGMPRKDLHIVLDGVEIKPGLALGSWAAFKRDNSGALVMGDLVLTEDEVEPVMMKLQEGGIQQSALHNHLIRESPHVMYMHIAGHGDAVEMAKAIHDAVALTKTPGPEPAPATPPTTELGIDQKQVEQALGHAGKVNGGVLQIGVPRAEPITDSGMTVPFSMGVGTAINFQPTGNGKAAIAGDFVLLGSEVNPVIKTLRQNGIQVTAIHSHMLMEEPRLFFMHFGRMTMRSNWLADSARHSTTPIQQNESAKQLDRTGFAERAPHRVLWVFSEARNCGFWWAHRARRVHAARSRR
jgi:hypothetical protein